MTQKNNAPYEAKVFCWGLRKFCAEPGREGDKAIELRWLVTGRGAKDGCGKRKGKESKPTNRRLEG